MMLLEELLTESRLLNVLHDNLSEQVKQSNLYKESTDFLQRYCIFNHLSAIEVIDIYTRYIVTYNKHCKQFSKTNLYPFQTLEKLVEFSRVEYDVILLMSVLFAPHRFRIMQLLKDTPQLTPNSLFIGVGPGLEMLLTGSNHQNVQAYDLSVNEFVFATFPNAKIKIELYKDQYQNFFDTIYLIELLEHLSDPFELLAISYNSLKKGGKILFTTATDIPQFDHLYNFPKDHTPFDLKLNQMGFNILTKEIISHNYLLLQVEPSNHFYIIEKK